MPWRSRSDKFLEGEYGELHRLEHIKDKRIFTKTRRDLGKGNPKGKGKGGTDQSDICTKWTVPHSLHQSLVPVRKIASQ